MKVKKKSTAKRANSKGKRSAVSAKANNIVLTTLAIGAAGIVGYLGWQYIKKKRNRSADLDSAVFRNTPSNIEPAGVKNTTTAISPSGNVNSPLPSDSLPSIPIDDPDIKEAMNTPIRIGGRRNKNKVKNDEFPLKRGSKGEKVRLLQQALITKYGDKILPKYGADGAFGAELVAALKKLKFSTTVSETLYNVLVGNGADSNVTDSLSLARQLFSAAQQRDFNKTISLLNSINSAAQYSSVSNYFKTFRLNGGARKTLVNGLLTTFTRDDQKQQLRLAFAKMGLQYDGNKWSLSGINGLPIITTMPARIWVNSLQSVTVPAHTVLGQQISRKLDYILFSNNGRYFLVHASCARTL
ncbi:MAG TPA: hypothetical protein VM802_10180 [Chitinophaga sp.]|uniref:peptidoglycan-binding domain-containing protein n=1 Tax=Chitinophaga sp. TaxID=1869181 RepID=UPI002D13EC8E|nr:hypothetical protein [Chitinophaga sp.]HVI45230.1 hypothetical protein [Chitinophaga sp.]